MKNRTLIFVLFLSVFITACGGGGSDTAASSTTTPTTNQTTTVAGSISISWDIPTTRVDTTLLPASEISGYKIYLSTSKTIIPAIPYATVTNKALSEHTIYNLESGTYTLYVTTYDTNGDESPYSDPISKTI